MKEVIAVIRPGKDKQTKEALSKAGHFACSTVRVYGRGKQRGLKYQSVSSVRQGAAQAVVMKYLPKKMISLVVPNHEVKTVVQTIIHANQTGQYGDGRVFVLEAQEAIRIRTGEKGEVVL